ncbi:MAG: VOC family protein [Gemmatimonadales bacterium]|nr:VOC family protein [Gemmatimonadales bacterium]
MLLDGIHHISCITGNAAINLEFYTRVMGLRLVAKTVNQDDPYVYHLFYADQLGSPGSDLTFFEYPGALPGRAGAGMVHRISFRVATEEALSFWEARLGAKGIAAERAGPALRFSDPEGLGLEIVIRDTRDPPLIAERPDIPRDMALTGFDGVRAYGQREGSKRVLEEVMGGAGAGEWTWEVRGVTRGGTIAFDPAPDLPARPGAGTVHHVAWATEYDEHEVWLERLQQAGIRSSPIVERFYFRSIYFREPGGVLYELATKGPGFTIDSPLEELGTRLILPPAFEPRRVEIEQRLTPLPTP